jgi:hypothetical protein
VIDQPHQAQEEERIGEVIALGSEITGGVGGVAVGFALAGPPGAIVGAAATPVISRLVRSVGDFAHRRLSARQKIRVGAVIRFAAADLEVQVAEGRRVRQDGFFAESPGDRAPFEEVAEAVMAAAEDAHEERKIAFLGTMLSEISLRPDVDRAAAITLTREARALTYRQILLLALFGRRAEFELRSVDYSTTPLSNLDPVVPVLAEIADLSSRNLVGIRGGAILGLTDVIPSVVEPAGLGVWLYNLMRLGRVQGADLASLVAAVSELPPATTAPAEPPGS